MLTLFDSAFSPFARKVRMVLEHKALPFTAVDGLHADQRAALTAVNPRREVPALVDGEMVVVNSAHIVAYLEDAYPQPAVLPSNLAQRTRARHWERIADTQLDPIIVDISLWSWANRADQPPAGLLAAAQGDLDAIYAELESELPQGDGFLCGELSIADIALFPHLSATRWLGVGVDAARFARLTAWLHRLAHTRLFRDDIVRLRAFLKKPPDPGIERDRIFWRGDRIEWVLAAGYHDWFFEEIRHGRVIWPGRPSQTTVGPGGERG